MVLFDNRKERIENMPNLKYIRYLTIGLSLLLLLDLYFKFFTMDTIFSIIFITIFVSSSFYLKIVELEHDIEVLKQHVFFLEKDNDNKNV